MNIRMHGAMIQIMKVPYVNVSINLTVRLGSEYFCNECQACITYINFVCHCFQICTGLLKSLRDFRTRLRNNRDRHGRKEHINR